MSEETSYPTRVESGSAGATQKEPDAVDAAKKEPDAVGGAKKVSGPVGTAKKPPFPVCPVLGVPVAITSIREVITELTSHLEEYRGGYVCVSNVHTTVMAYDDPAYLRAHREAMMALPDGKPLVFVCRKKGFSGARRVAGPDLLPALLRYSEGKGFRHFFYGSTEETLHQLEKNLRRKYPKLQIAGMYSPPFRHMTEEEDEEAVRMINASRPDFIWVGLGAPKQERWMYEHAGRVSGIMFGVGAAFDFQAGTSRRAPKWMQECYLEWLFRLLQDPKRLMHRYFTTNVRFVLLNLKHGLR